jgi:hypothetical protein
MSLPSAGPRKIHNLSWIKRVILNLYNAALYILSGYFPIDERLYPPWALLVKRILKLSVVDPDPDPDPQGSETFCRIRIRNSRLWIRIRIRNWT